MKKTIMRSTFVLVILAMFCGVYIIKYNNSSKVETFNKEDVLVNNIELLGYELDLNYSPKEKNYSLNVEEDKVYISCDTDLDITGCNEYVEIPNNQYIHTIIVDDSSTYTITINKIVDNNNLRIKSIDGIPLLPTEEEATIVINSENPNVLYSFNDGETWQESNEIKINENQVLNIKLKDSYGNVSKTKTIPIKNFVSNASGFLRHANNNSAISSASVASGSTNIVGNRILFINNGATQISKASIDCTGTCQISLPTIIRNGWNIIGWNTKKDGTGKSYRVGENATIEKGTVLYAQTSKTVKITFYKNGAAKIDSTSNESITKTCNLKNDQKTCSLVTPTITTSDNKKIVGWTDIPEGTKDNKLFEPRQTINVAGDKNFFASTYKTIKIEYESNGAQISKKTDSCTIYNKNKDCTVKLPSITRNNIKVLRATWSYGKNAIDVSLKPNQNSSFREDTKLYAVTENQITVSFKAGKNTTLKNRINSITCKSINNDTCKIKTPKKPAIKESGFKFIGWNNSYYGTNGYGENETVKVKNNITLYAIFSNNILKAEFLSGNIELSEKIQPLTCEKKSNGRCNVKAPEGKANGWIFVGWDFNKNTTKPTFHKGDSLNISEDSKYYAIFKKAITVKIDKGNADSLSFYETKCYSFGNGCRIDLPQIISKGNEIDGFYYEGRKLTYSLNNFKADATIKANVKNNYRKGKLNVSETYQLNKYTLEIVNNSTTNKNQKEAMIKYAKKINENMPVLFSYVGKMTFMDENTFHNIWDQYKYSGAGALTYGPLEYTNIDSRIPDNSNSINYYKAVIAHELGHGLDRRYGDIFGKKISDQDDIKGIYNKYNKTKKFKEWTNPGELVADLVMHYYYYKYDKNFKHDDYNLNETDSDYKYVFQTIDKYIRQIPIYKN